MYVGSLKHTITIVNNSSISVRGELFVPLIKNETSRRYIVLCNISSSNKVQRSVFNDSSGNIYLHWDDLVISGKHTFRAELNYYVFSLSVRYLINSSSVENYDKNSEVYEKYTKAEELIECNDPKIVSLAHNLTDNLDDWHEKAVKIYDFVHHHVHYKVQEEERGALWALEKGVGDCSEYSYLFVALCRAAGIPARIQAGFAFHHSSETLEDGHMWAEYYLENYGWIPVDATWRLLDAIDDKHFSSIQSIPENMSYANYFFHCKTKERNVGDNQSVSVTPSSTDVFDHGFVENVMKTVQKINQAKFAILLGKLFGTHLIFPSEAKDIEQTFLESKIQLQNAIDSWHGSTEIAESNAANALENIGKSLQNAWMLIVKIFMIFISISTAIMLTALFFLKRYLAKEEREAEQKFHLHGALILN